MRSPGWSRLSRSHYPDRVPRDTRQAHRAPQVPPVLSATVRACDGVMLAYFTAHQHSDRRERSLTSGPVVGSRVDRGRMPVFSQFHGHRIDPRRILVASNEVERLRPEDRQLKLKRRRGKSGGQADDVAKPRSGRPVTPRLLDSASGGKPIPGPAKTRLLRAVNRVLEQKKKSGVELKALF